MSRDAAPIPTVVGDLRWPVISAVRLNASDPAEYIVIADCGEGTPHERYATLRVTVWPDRTVAQQGQYDLSFTQAQRSMLQRADLTDAMAGVLEDSGHKVIRATQLAELRAAEEDAITELATLSADAENTGHYSVFDERDYDHAFAAQERLRQVIA